MMDPTRRMEMACATADALADRATLIGQRRALVGLDGFVDSIMEVVGTRRGVGDFDRLATIPEFAQRIASAAGKSTNIELVVRRRQPGGNAPLMAGGLLALGVSTSFIGAVGDPNRPGTPHPVHADWVERCDEVIVTGPPALTDAVEFDDGKVMLGQLTMFDVLTFDLLREQVGIDRLRELVGACDLLCLLNWTMLPGMTGIWRGMLDEVLPGLPDPGAGRRCVFVDLADPAKRPADDLREALSILTAIESHAAVTLGLNLAEAAQVARVCGVDDSFAAGARAEGDRVQRAAAEVRSALGLHAVVIHPREGAAGASADGASAWIDGPFFERPRISTGGGDHFNAGVALAQLAGLGIEHMITAGTAAGGYYVSHAASPTFDQLVEYLRVLPPTRAD
jgi:hypothetical protein